MVESFSGWDGALFSNVLGVPYDIMEGELSHNDWQDSFLFSLENMELHNEQPKQQPRQLLIDFSPAN